MENWKLALVIGSAATGAILLLRGKSTAGIVMAGIGLATLAAEDPDKFAHLRRKARYYAGQGITFLEVASRVGERIAEVSERGVGSQWLESLLEGDRS